MLNLTHVIGIFTYALVLGIVSDDVQQTVESFKTGNTAVMERDHTIVLNSNRTTPNLLRQARPPCSSMRDLTPASTCVPRRTRARRTLSTARTHVLQWAKAQDERGQRAPIVVLSNVPKAELDELVDEARAETGLDIMGRSGVPYSLDDLDLVNARHARTILIMDPQHHATFEVRGCTRCSSDT